MIDEERIEIRRDDFAALHADRDSLRAQLDVANKYIDGMRGEIRATAMEEAARLVLSRGIQLDHRNLAMDVAALAPLPPGLEAIHCETMVLMCQLVFECDGVTDVKAPSRETYNAAFDALALLNAETRP